MAKRSSSSVFSSLFIPRGDAFLLLIALISIFSLLAYHISASNEFGHLEGFMDMEEDGDYELPVEEDAVPLPRSTPPPISLSTSRTPESHHGPPDHIEVPYPPSDSDTVRNSKVSPSTPSFEYWDEDEFEGIPENLNPAHVTEGQLGDNESANAGDSSQLESDANNLLKEEKSVSKKFSLSKYWVEMICVPFLIMFGINYFTGKKENENLALAWVSRFATKDSIFDKNFSLMGVGETEDSALLLKEGQNVFKFYASGRRFCSGLVATMELKSRHDLISRLYNMVVPCKDEMTVEVYMNDDSMDQVVFALARKKLAKTMQKEVGDLLRFAALVAPPNGKKWAVEELQVVAESKEVAADLMNETVLDQVFGDKAFEKVGKYFISMHISDQHLATHKKMLVFKFAIPDAKNMVDMTRLVALVPYYIDLIGRYKLSSHARSKTDATRSKLAQEIHKELQNVRNEALSKKKAEQRKKQEEAEAKLSAEALRKKEAKDRARQMKKAMPKMKMSRGS